MKKLIVLILFSNSLLAQTFNIKDFGAIADGKTVNTQSIQKAIDQCNTSGGGTVLVPAGTFITGTIFLKSHVNLHIQHGGLLKGSDNLSDFQVNGVTHGMVYAIDCEDISLTGDGEINGNGTHFMIKNKVHNFIDYDTKYIRQGSAFMQGENGVGDGPIAYTARPSMMIVIYHSTNVKIKDLRLTDPAEWTTRISECENVECIGLTILTNLLIPNSDGINCATSRNVVISNCIVHSGDDSIVVTGFGDETGVGGYTETARQVSYKFGNKTKIAENVVVTNCILQSRSAGIRIGYGMNNVRNLIFSNLTIVDSNRGIGIFCRDNSTIENITFSNIHIQCRLHTGKWWGRGEPIHISSIKMTGTEKLGRIRAISFSDIKITQAEAGIVVNGNKESLIEDLTFKNINIKLQNGPLSKTYGGNFDMRPSVELSTSLYSHDIPAFYASFVKNIDISNVSNNWLDTKPEGYYTNGLFIENYIGLTLEKNKFVSSNISSKSIVLKNDLKKVK